MFVTYFRHNNSSRAEMGLAPGPFARSVPPCPFLSSSRDAASMTFSPLY
jgi:hypothetical protein